MEFCYEAQGARMNVFELKTLTNANQIGWLLCKPSNDYNETNLVRSKKTLMRTPCVVVPPLMHIRYASQQSLNSSPAWGQGGSTLC